MKNLAIMMADLSGFTAMTEIHGAATAAEMVGKYLDLLTSSLTGDAVHLETVGDQVVVVSPNADDLALTALRLFQKTRGEQYFLSVHAGLHFGEVLEVNGRYFGSSMNLTARIASAAKTNEILCSGDFMNALADPAYYQFGATSERKFKNILRPVPVVELRVKTEALQPENQVCPVCRMQLGEENNLFFYQDKNQILYFCSEECREIFEKELAYN